MILGVLTFFCSWWLKAQTLHRLTLYGPIRKPDSDPTFWDHLGEALYLRSRANRAAPGRAATAQEAPPEKGELGVSDSPRSLASATVPLPGKKRSDVDISWDGP